LQLVDSRASLAVYLRYWLARMFSAANLTVSSMRMVRVCGRLADYQKRRPAVAASRSQRRRRGDLLPECRLQFRFFCLRPQYSAIRAPILDV